MIRTIDTSVLMPRSLEIQQANQNMINARSDIKQEAFSQQVQEKTTAQLRQVTNTNETEKGQTINKDGRNGASGGGTKKKREKNKEDEIKENKSKENQTNQKNQALITNTNYRGRILPTNKSIIDIKL